MSLSLAGTLVTQDLAMSNVLSSIIPKNKGQTIGSASLPFAQVSASELALGSSKLTPSTLGTITRNNGPSQDFGFITQYNLKIDELSKDILAINDANFELGALFNVDPENDVELPLDDIQTPAPGNTFIVKEFTTPLYDFDDTGKVTLFTETQKMSPLNKLVNTNSISVNPVTTNEGNTRYLVPIELNTLIRDVYPLNILDLNQRNGRNKFKTDFDNVGSLYFTNIVDKLSGVHNLKNFAQLSDRELSSQYRAKSGNISLSRYESVVDFISYYNVPIVFEDEFVNINYQCYLSPLPSFRKANKHYTSDAPISSVNDISSLTLNTELSSTLFPTIKVIKWKNIFTPTFTPLDTTDFVSIKENLGWSLDSDSASLMNATAIYQKYTTGTNTGENWIKKLIEITYAYIKYGKPMKILTVQDSIDVNDIFYILDPNEHLVLDEQNFEISIIGTLFDAYISDSTVMDDITNIT
jgi:hypothetical protein